MDSQTEVEIREMTEQDLEEVLQIERMSFPTPWSRNLFQRELIIPYARALVAWNRPSQQILGYLCLWIVTQEAHILNLAVHPRRRRQGLGSKLLRSGLEDALAQGAQEVTLEVRRSNYKAIALYRTFHFQPQGIRPRYYSDSGEDAVIMGLSLLGNSGVVTSS